MPQLILIGGIAVIVVAVFYLLILLPTWLQRRQDGTRIEVKRLRQSNNTLRNELSSVRDTIQLIDVASDNDKMMKDAVVAQIDTVLRREK